MEKSELKRKLRELKRLEIQLRFENKKEPQYKQCVWNEYFSTKDENDGKVKYNMSRLLTMNHTALKEVFNEFFYNVYFQYYKENGILPEGMYDIALLSSLGLPQDASSETIKKKFRELAKKYHPDLGGDSSKFVKLVDTYKKLLGEE